MYYYDQTYSFDPIYDPFIPQEPYTLPLTVLKIVGNM